MFKKPLLSQFSVNTNSPIANGLRQKFVELSLDDVDSSLTEIKIENQFKFKSENSNARITGKEKQQEFVKHLFGKSTEFKNISLPRVQSTNADVKFVSVAKKVLFPKKINKNRLIKPSKLNPLVNYVKPGHLISFYSWLHQDSAQKSLDVDNLIQSLSNEQSEIKKLVPDKYRLGSDIVPSYLLKKTKKSKPSKSDIRKSPTNKFSGIIKAHKVFGCQSNIETNIGIFGTQKSGKSSLIGQILINLNVLDRNFVKKTDWEAQKAKSDDRKTAWLIDTLSSERQFKETIVSSSNSIQLSEKFFNLIDSPGNLAYYPQIIESISSSDCVVLVVNPIIDWCRDSSNLSTPFHDYLLFVFRLLKIFSIDRVEIVLVNCGRIDCDIERKIVTKIGSMWKKFNKTRSITTHFRVIDLTNIDAAEIDMILREIGRVEPIVRQKELDQPLLMEIIDVFKPVESALPVVVGKVLRGGVSVGVKSVAGKGIVVPGSTSCTVKSMKIWENNEWKTRSFAFPGDLVELTMPEINNEDRIKRGDFLCHPEYPLITGMMFRVQMLILDCDNIDIPIINGMKMYLWTKSRGCFCELVRIDSCEYVENKQKIVMKHPRLIQVSGSSVTAELRTDDLLAVEINSLYKLDVFLLFSGLRLFAAGKFINIIH